MRPVNFVVIVATATGPSRPGDRITTAPVSRTFGVEEELLLVDEVGGEPLPLGQEVVDRHSSDERLTTEFQLEQAEIGVHPHESMEALSPDIKDSRASADAAARAAGARVTALATSPLPVVPHTTPQPRYEVILDRFGITTREQLPCGCHVHVSVDPDEQGVAVLDRIRALTGVGQVFTMNMQSEENGWRIQDRKPRRRF
ncbi:glutamate-cysteine ligase family protein [Arthrobacter sp. H14]|uniref:glutamate-cysteine ligase family protein n=1 Tax=Arthrobacter sp. H14 TaxID=1312959 RepID=UPI00138B05E1|nr:glutamate-cysteine ligase family protein [Arthrobacter sp. H14]